MIILNGWLKIDKNIDKEKRKKFFVKILDLSSLYKLKKKIKVIEVKKKLKI